MNSFGGTGAHTYAWSNSTTSSLLVNVGDGTYYVTVTDANGCTFDDSLTFIEPTRINPTTSVILNYHGEEISCYGAADGQGYAVATGGTPGYEYQWSNGIINDTVSYASAGDYYVAVYDANGCVVIDTLTFTQPDSIQTFTAVVSNFNGAQISCFGLADGKGFVAGIGGTGVLTYTWNNGAFTDTIDNLEAGTYVATVTDLNGCFKKDSITLSQPDSIAYEALVITDYNGQDISCYGASDANAAVISSGGTGNLYYNWNTGSTNDTIFNQGPGSYTVTIRDDNGCAKLAKVDITQPDSMISYTNVLSNYNGRDISCYGYTNGVGSAYSSGGTGTHTYTWSNGTTSPLLVNMGAGTYTVAIYDINGCYTTSSITFAQPDTISNAYTTTNVSCNGGNDGTIDITPTGGTMGYTYFWDGPGQFTDSTEDLTGATAGVYTLTITDTNGCIRNDEFIVLDPSAISPDFDYGDVKCYGGNDGFVHMQVTGGTPTYTYNWVGPTGYVFADPTAANQDSLIKGQYTIIVSDNNGCFTSIRANIDQPDSLEMTHTLEHAICFGYTNGYIDVDVTGGVLPYSYAWSTSETTDSIFNLGAGMYDVTITDTNGCQIADTFEITHPDSLEVTLYAPVMTNGYNITYNGGSDGSIDASVVGGTLAYTYSWNTGDDVEDLFGLDSGTYSITVIDANGCMDTASIQLIDPLPLTLASGFTPNGDGSNDTYVIRGLDAFSNNIVTIYNRWGDVVFKEYDYQNTWDGSNASGNPVPDGTYFILLEIRKEEIVLKGYIDLRR